MGRQEQQLLPFLLGHKPHRDTKREREREGERKTFEIFPAVVLWGFMESIYRAYSSPLLVVLVDAHDLLHQPD